MKIAFVVQRYGAEIIGGAEYFTRLIAEKLNQYHDIEILTTCAHDYHTWENKYLNETDSINGIVVHRFLNSKLRDNEDHMLIQEKVFNFSHEKEHEIKWIEEQGPFCPDLIKYIINHKYDYDLFLFFTYRYYPSFYGIKEVAQKSIICPFAENDPALNLSTTQDIFNNVKGIIYSTPEEQKLINSKIKIDNNVLSSIIGCGINIPNKIMNENNCEKYILYLGRIEGSKGCYELFDYYLKIINENESYMPDLLLAGHDAIPIPQHKKIKYIGFISEQEKYTLLQKAEFLIMPSMYESFSLVTLESLACGTPVLVNGACEVLKGHCLRSNGGLWYRNYNEFKACFNYLLKQPLNKKMGNNGLKYIKETYSWNIIIEKYIQFFNDIEKSIN